MASAAGPSATWLTGRDPAAIKCHQAHDVKEDEKKAWMAASEQVYPDVDESGEENGGESAQVRIGHESTNEGHHRGDAAPVIDVLGRRLQLLVQHPGEVDDEIGGQSEVAQPLTELNRCQTQAMVIHHQD